jgi:hypothetical protein
MSVTFTNDPAGSNRDLVRIIVNDTTGKLSDETIAYFLASEPSVWYAAAMCADTIAGQYSQAGDLTVGDLTIRRNVAEYRSLARSLRQRGSLGAVPFAGGISQADKDAETSDTDRVAPAFRVGQTDDPGSTY